MAAQRHGDGSGICEQPHVCPACEDGTGPCVDLFEHPICGLVACSHG